VDAVLAQLSPNLARRAQRHAAAYAAWSARFQPATANGHILRYVKQKPGSQWINVGVTAPDGKALAYGWSVADQRWSFHGGPPRDVLVAAQAAGLPADAVAAALSAPAPASASPRAQRAHEAPQAPSAPVSHAAKLRALADGMTEQIEEKLTGGATSNQRWTARRASVMDQMRMDGENLVRVQSVLRGIADLQDAGTAGEFFLDHVNTKAAVQNLVRLTRRDTQWPYANEDHIARIRHDLTGKAGVTKISAALRGYIAGTDRRVPLDPTVAQAIVDAAKLGSTHAKRWEDEARLMLQLEDYGIRYPEQLTILREKIRELMQTKPITPRAPDNSWQQYVNKIPGFIPTPPDLAEIMAETAYTLWDNPDEATPTILEPSAGNGHLVAAALRQWPQSNIDAFEINSTLSAMLQQAYAGNARVHVRNADFTRYHDVMRGKYDIVLMNPPFEHGQDIDHVRIAYDALRMDGVVVAIMSSGPFFRSTRKDVDFREWLDSIGGEHKPLAENAFKQYGTSVRAEFVTIVKREADTRTNGTTYDDDSDGDTYAAPIFVTVDGETVTAVSRDERMRQYRRRNVYQADAVEDENGSILIPPVGASVEFEHGEVEGRVRWKKGRRQYSTYISLLE